MAEEQGKKASERGADRDPLLESILGEATGEDGFDPEEEGEGSAMAAAGGTGGFGAGDLAPVFGGEEGERKPPRERAEWQATLRAVQADLPPTMGFLFRSWVARHREMAQQVPVPQLFSWWLFNVAHRDFLADQQRPEEERQYDPVGLYVQDLLPMIQAEVRAEREAIVDEVRQAFLARLQPLVDQRLIPRETLELLGAAGLG